MRTQSRQRSKPLCVSYVLRLYPCVASKPVFGRTQWCPAPAESGGCDKRLSRHTTAERLCFASSVCYIVHALTSQARNIVHHRAWECKYHTSHLRRPEDDSPRTGHKNCPKTDPDRSLHRQRILLKSSRYSVSPITLQTVATVETPE